MPTAPPPPPPPPPPPAPGALPSPPVVPPPFTSLSTIVSTIAGERIDLEGTLSPFNEDYYTLLRSFESHAFREMAAEFHRYYVEAGDPNGRLLVSVLPSVSSARGRLAEMRSTRATRRQDSNVNPGLAKMFRDYRAGLLGGRPTDGSTARMPEERHSSGRDDGDSRSRSIGLPVRLRPVAPVVGARRRRRALRTRGPAERRPQRFVTLRTDNASGSSIKLANVRVLSTTTTRLWRGLLVRRVRSSASRTC